MKRPRKGSKTFFNEMDIAEALRGWAFEPGQVNVRLIRGNDGKPKLQLRLDLGLLQMELEGRPDGKRPHRAPTELEFHQRKLGNHRKKYGSDAGFWPRHTLKTQGPAGRVGDVLSPVPFHVRSRTVRGGDSRHAAQP